MTTSPVLAQLEFAYYPGCSLEGVSWEYDASFRAVCQQLGIRLVEVPGWKCCGGSSAHSIDPAFARQLARENLTLAAKAGRLLVIPCPACYRNLHRARGSLAPSDETRAAGEHGAGRKEAGPASGTTAVELWPAGGFPSKQASTSWDGLAAPASYGGATGGADSCPGPVLLHVNQFFCHPAVRERLREGIRRPLSGLRPVPYYGCLVTRTEAAPESPEIEDPTAMDELLGLVGASVRPWAYKTACCGGSLGLTRPAIVEKIVAELIEQALAAGANCLVTDCPLCFANVDARQPDVLRRRPHLTPLPVFYVTELVGLAMGVEGIARCLRRHCVDPFSLLESLGLHPDGG